MAGSGTPRTMFTTPKPKRSREAEIVASRTPIRAPKTPVVGTPECFTAVTMETPTSGLRRRSSKDKVDQVSNLTVAVRIRPMNARELACVGAANVVKVREKELTIRTNTYGNSSMNLDHIFHYDQVFYSCDETSPQYSSQEDVFETMGEPLLDSAFHGYNACLFAYGQTGSGKSFSMMGRNNVESFDIDSEHAGIIPRFCRSLFERVHSLSTECTVEVSFFEIYNEKIHDLLAGQTFKTPLKVREHPEWGPYVVDLSVHTVKSYKDLRDWLILGNRNRATSATAMNEVSSRSHSIFTIELSLLSATGTSSRSKVSLVDLAGSERLNASHNSEEKIRQGVSINKSLLTLGKVISALADQKKNQFVPYRDSVLTWLLRESLGGNSLTSMLATITPANTNLDETLATLRYACQARSIVNRARINENPHDRKIRELKTEIERLKALKLDYERNSFNSSEFLCDNSGQEELEELRHKLSKKEEQLQSAEKTWERRYMECTQKNLKELAESEKRREELESKVRVLDRVDHNIELELYKTNFLEEIETLLKQDSVVLDKIEEWCAKNDFNYNVHDAKVTITDRARQREASFLLKSIEKCADLTKFFANLTWTDVEKNKTLNKNEVISALNKIYKTLDSLKPAETENNLNLLFAKVNKSLQSFETALLNTVKYNSQKSVTFNV